MSSFNACFIFSDHLFTCLLESETHPCLFQQPFCILARCTWGLNAIAFPSVLFFYFVSVLTWSILSCPRSQTSSLLTFLSANSDSGERAGWKRGSESIFSTKIIFFPQHVQQLQREFDIWGDWVTRVLTYLTVGKRGIGSNKSAAWAVSLGFRRRRNYSQKTPRTASLNAVLITL